MHLVFPLLQSVQKTFSKLYEEMDCVFPVHLTLPILAWEVILACVRMASEILGVGKTSCAQVGVAVGVAVGVGCQ